VITMADATTASRLLRRLRGLVSAPTGPDLGDCGTAFGLDMSMQAESMPAAAQPRGHRDAGWWRRLAARRSMQRP
jgi:hypothetical protein